MPPPPRPLQIPAASILGFPVTPYTESGAVDLALFGQQVEILLSYGAKAIFPGCGTGEMSSLSLTEQRALVAECVKVVRGRVPVIAGIGFGLAIAQDMMRAAADAGADAVLAFPPVAPGVNEDSLFEYYAAIAAAAQIAVIIYQRDLGRVQPQTLVRLAAISNIVGLKDGTGQIDLLQQQVMAIGNQGFSFFNGTPTAELFVPAFVRCGVASYSSALLNVMPEFAAAFNAALQQSADDMMADLIRRVVIPFVQLRDRAPGYAVSLIKAGVRLRGIPVGKVRPPVPEPSPADQKDLIALLDSLGLSGPLRPGGGSAAPWQPPAEPDVQS